MNRRITNHQPIYAFGVECGYLQTIQTDGFQAVEIEYNLDKEYRRQGIMTTYLSIYLAELKRRGFKNIVAHVKQRNYASKKLLKRNGFVKFNKIRDVEIFICILGFNLTAQKLETVREVLSTK